jgi:single-stranded DNA-specific DHH superfamily exonuclease
MWEPSQDVNYVEPDERNKQYTELADEYSKLLSKMNAITILIEQAVEILLSYNPKLAEQTKEELEKINEETDDKGDESTGDST